MSPAVELLKEPDGADIVETFCVESSFTIPSAAEQLARETRAIASACQNVLGIDGGLRKGI